MAAIVVPILLPRAWFGLTLIFQGAPNALFVISAIKKRHTRTTLQTCLPTWSIITKTKYAKLCAPTTQSKEAKKSSLSASFASAPLGSGSDRHNQLVDTIAGFVVQDMRPLSVEEEGFRKLMKVAELRFKLPSWTHFTQTVIPPKYSKVRSGVESFLSSIQYCSITTDLRTAKYQTRGY